MGDPPQQLTRVRYGVMGYLCSLAFILYIDRVCISQAGTAMKAELNLSNTQWGMVGGAFMIAYAIFEVITGHWGDRFGSRRVLTRIVLWWSVFTALTGSVFYFTWDPLGQFGSEPWVFHLGDRYVAFPVLGSLFALILVRFLFGCGEAGAYPNVSRVV